MANELRFPRWYRRTDGFFGRMAVQATASAVYVVVCLGPIIAYVASPYTIGPKWRSLVLVWAILVAIGYPGWAWLETIAFERWIRRQGFDEHTEKEERQYFQAMIAAAGTFWKGVFAIYATAAVLKFAW